LFLAKNLFSNTSKDFRLPYLRLRLPWVLLDHRLLFTGPFTVRNIQDDVERRYTGGRITHSNKLDPAWSRQRFIGQVYAVDQSKYRSQFFTADMQQACGTLCVTADIK